MNQHADDSCLDLHSMETSSAPSDEVYKKVSIIGSESKKNLLFENNKIEVISKSKSSNDLDSSTISKWGWFVSTDAS